MRYNTCFKTIDAIRTSHFSKTMPNHILHIFLATLLCKVRVQLLNYQTLENIRHIMTCWATGILYQARMGHFTFQMLLNFTELQCCSTVVNITLVPTFFIPKSNKIPPLKNFICFLLFCSQKCMGLLNIYYVYKTLHQYKQANNSIWLRLVDGECY